MSTYQWHMDEIASETSDEYDAGQIIEEFEYDSYAEIFETFMNTLPASDVQRDVYLKYTDDDGEEYKARPTGSRLETFFQTDEGENGPMVPNRFQTEMQSII